MDWKAHLRRTLGNAVPQWDEDVIEEVAQHAAALYERARADGLESEAARHRVEDQLAALSREARAMRRPPRRPPVIVPPPPSRRRALGLAQDITHAARRFRRQPGHAAVTILTMALGIGAATVLFSVAYGVLLRPLPWPDADRLVRLYETRTGSTRRLPPLMTNLSYREWRETPSTIDGLAAWSTRTLAVTEAGASERIPVAAVTASLFPLLRAEPLLGTLFGPDDERDEADQVVLSHGLWQQRFGGDPATLGRTLRLDDRSYRVTAIMPASFVFPDRSTRAWIPFHVPPVSTPGTEGWTLRMFGAIARLKPGFSPQQAAAEGTARGRGGPDAGPVAMAVFGSDGPVEVTAVPALQAQTAEVRPALLMLLTAAGLLLLTATANVASLQLARGVARRREIAIRSAIGASTGQVTRQLLVESSLLGLAGGLAGLLLAAWLHRALPVLLPADFPRAADVAMDWRVAGFAILVSLGTGLAFGLLPALHARRIAVSAALAEDGLAPTGGGRSATARARGFIMAGQIAVACVLLIGASLLARSFVALISAERGYDPHNVLTARLVLPDYAYSPARRAALVTDLLERLRGVPGVARASMTTSLPLTSGEMLSSFPMPSPRGEGTVSVQAGVRHVSPEYFLVMRMRLLNGRSFTDDHHSTSPGVAVVNEAFAKKYLSETPLRDRLPSRVGRDEAGADIIGIVENVRHRGVTDDPQPEIYYSYRQLPSGLSHDEPLLALRTSGDPRRLVPTLRALVQQQDPVITVESILTMEDRLMTSLARPRLYTLLLSGFAAFALVIAGVGLFGVLAYSVAQRSREIGVRTALGATRRDVVTLVLRQGLTIAGAGIVTGLLFSLAAARYLASTLHGVTPHDPVSFTAMPALLVIVAALACTIPARRAAQLDPLRALRG